MLEQAVYAGRNHTVSLAVALATSLMLAPPRAATTSRASRLGSEIQSLIAGPDGGAWVRISADPRVALGRAPPTAVGTPR